MTAGRLITQCRGTCRRYRRITIPLTLCLVVSCLLVLITTDRERFGKRAQDKSMKDRNLLTLSSKIFRNSPPQSNTSNSNAVRKDIDFYLQVDPYQPLSEFVLNALYNEGRRPLKRMNFQFGSNKKTPKTTKKLSLMGGNKTEISNKAHSSKKLSASFTKLHKKKQIEDIQPVASSQKKNHSYSNVTDGKSYKAVSVKRKISQDVQELSFSANSGKVTDSSSFEYTNSFRLSRVSAACSKFSRYWQNFRPQAEFYHSPGHKLLYCKVAKGGCTFWEQFFSFILREDSMKAGNYNTMYEIPRWRIHFDEAITPPSNFWSIDLQKISQSTTRYMFTRDPFSRIWSAYVDKIWLPDFWYWMKIGKHHTLDITDRCLYDVTFSDFVEYISNKNKSNKHWAPVHQSCNPCVFKPHIIGNMSTFASDAKHILQTSGLDSYLSIYDHAKRVRIELKMLVQYNYMRFKDKHRIYQQCNFTEKDLAYRLWRTFQINGYIAKEHQFPRELKSFTEESVLSSILSNVEHHSLSREESSSQRRFYLEQAYKSVPHGIIKNMIKRFEPDFHLFGFDRSPSFLLKPGQAPVLLNW